MSWSQGYSSKSPANGLDVGNAKFKRGSKSDGVRCIE